jgi:hypothetical protein
MFSLRFLCVSLCLCGESFVRLIHHRDTEATPRTTENDYFPPMINFAIVCNCIFEVPS